MAVAVIARRMMKREKDFCLLKAMRLARKAGVFNRNIFATFQK
jgi:hypothetical protein